MNIDDHKDDDFGLVADRDNPIVDTSARNYEQVGPVRGVGAVKAIANPANRGRLAFIALSGVVLLGGLAYAMFSVDHEDANKAAVGSIQNGTKVNTSAGTAPSELQRTAAEEYNANVLPEVQKEDPSAHPVVVVDENPYQPKAELNSPSKVSDVGKSPRQEPQGASGQRQTSAQQQEFKEADKLITQLIEGEGVNNQPRAYTVSWSYPQPQGQSEQGHSVAGAGQAAAVPAKTRCNRIVRAGEMFMGTTDLALNSDVGGPAALTIRNGKLRNYQLIGAFERKETWMRLEFTKLVSGKETIGVSAIGLDVDTTLNAVEGDVDRHLMYRYGWWGFGTVLKAVGTAAEKNADQQVYVTDGTPIQSSQADASRELKMALGSLGTDIGGVMQDRLNRPITVSLNVGDEVGVFFLEDVCSKNDGQG